jgi:Smg protein
MKENMLDVLMYLFQNYMDGELEFEPDRDTLHTELLEAGFVPPEIDKAFDWLDGLASIQDTPQAGAQANNSFRFYTELEREKLDLECLNVLIYLERMGVMNSAIRELVIDRIMALDAGDIDVERLKWIILMVLFNQPDQDISYEWVENVVFDSAAEILH